MEDKRKHKIIVIADDSHMCTFDSLFSKSGVELDYICDVSQNPGKSLDQENIHRYLLNNKNSYAGAVVCGCCADSLQMITDKKIFPGKVIFFRYGQVNGDFPVESIRQKVDLYVDGVQHVSEFTQTLRQTLEM